MIMKCLKWRDWRLKNQVCFLIIMESLVIFFAVITVEIINIRQLLKIQEISKEIAFYQIYKQLNIQSQQYAQLAQITIKRSIFRTITMNTLYEQQSSLLEIQQPFDCLLGQKDQYSWASSYCYNFYGITENSKKVTKFKQFTSLATQTLLIQDIDIDVLFLSLDQSIYYSRYSGKDLTGYDPLERSWYFQFVNQTNPILISKPYLTFGFRDYVFSVSTLLSDIGMITSEFHFHDIDYQTNDPMSKVSMIDSSGLIYLSSIGENIGTNIMSQGYSSENLLRINDKRSHKLQPDCPLAKDIFCLIKHNSEIEIIVINDLGLQDIFLILQYSPNIQIKQINKELELIYLRLYMIFIQYTILYIVLRIVSIIGYLTKKNVQQFHAYSFG